jgi:hypothetical protein
MIIPKKEILYAPMLGTLGGGSARGFGRGRKGGLQPYFGSHYSGFTNNNPINVLASSTGSASSVGSSERHDALDFFADFANNVVYGGYNTIHKYTNAYPNHTSTYGGNDDYYRVNANNRVDLAGATNASLSSNGRGVTIAYMGASKTPVVLIGAAGDTHNTGNSNGGIYFFDLATGNNLGRMVYQHSDGPSVTPLADLAGLAWDGTHILAVTRTPIVSPQYPDGGVLHRLEMPNSVTQNGSLTVANEINIIAPVFYGLAWYGSGVYMGDNNNNGYVSKIALDFDNNSSSLLGPQAQYTMGDANNYSVALDYKNRRLLVGGYNATNLRSFGE